MSGEPTFLSGFREGLTIFKDFFTGMIALLRRLFRRNRGDRFHRDLLDAWLRADGLLLEEDET